MKKDRIVGVLREARGTLKDRTGKTFGNAQLHAQGKAGKIAGKGPNALGQVKDGLRDSAKDGERR